MIIAIVALIVGVVLGVVLHGRIVKEDLLIAEKVKALVGAKIAAIKAAEDAAKAEGAKLAAGLTPGSEVKAVEKKI